MLYHNIQCTMSKHSLLSGDQTANSFFGLTSRLVARKKNPKHFVAQLLMEEPFAASIWTVCTNYTLVICAVKIKGNVFNKGDDQCGNGWTNDWGEWNNLVCSWDKTGRNATAQCHWWKSFMQGNSLFRSEPSGRSFPLFDSKIVSIWAEEKKYKVKIVTF